MLSKSKRRLPFCCLLNLKSLKTKLLSNISILSKISTTAMVALLEELGATSEDSEVHINRRHLSKGQQR